MRAREFVAETATAGATAAGSVASVAMPVGAVIRRPQSYNTTKYTNMLTKRRKKLDKI